jgi:hypothetical protein
MELAKVYVKIGADVAQLERGLSRADRGVSEFSRTAEKMGPVVTRAVAAVSAAFAGIKLGGLIKDTALLSARFETLGVVTQVVGRNAGYTVAQIRDYEQGLRRSGIAAVETRETIARLTQAQVDLAHSTSLARIAQDAAVIGNTNSSEAFSRMVYGIQSAQVEILRTIGLNVNFESSYRKLAQQLGKSQTALSEQEKTQARVNAVLEAGGRIAGTYEAAMGTAGKQLGSMNRLVKDLGVTFGRVFNSSLRQAVFGTSNALSRLQRSLNDLGDDRIDQWGERLAQGLREAAAAGTALAGVLLLQGARRGVDRAARSISDLRAAMRARSQATIQSTFAQQAEAAATMAVASAREKEAVATAKSLQATHAAIALSRQEATMKLRQARAVEVAAARVSIESMRPLGGRVVELELARRAEATRAVSAATRELAILGQQEARVKTRLTAATAALSTAQAANASATRTASAAAGVHTAALGRLTLAGRAATAAMSAFRGVVAFLGGPVGAAITALGALAFAFWKAGDRARQAAAEAKDAARDFRASLAGMTETELLVSQADIDRQIFELERALANTPAKLTVQLAGDLDPVSGVRAQGGTTESDNPAFTRLKAQLDDLTHSAAATEIALERVRAAGGGEDPPADTPLKELTDRAGVLVTLYEQMRRRGEDVSAVVAEMVTLHRQVEQRIRAQGGALGEVGAAARELQEKLSDALTPTIEIDVAKVARDLNEQLKEVRALLRPVEIVPILPSRAEQVWTPSGGINQMFRPNASQTLLDRAAANANQIDPNRTMRDGAKGPGALGQIGGAFSEAAGALKAKLTPAVMAAGAAVAILAPVFRGMQEVLGPVISALAVPLTMIGKVVGLMLVPVLKLLFNPLKYLGIAVAWVAEQIQRAIGAVLRFVGRIPGLGALRRLGNAMVESADAIREQRKELEGMNFTDAMESATEAAQSFAETVSNLPRAINLELFRYRASTAGLPNGGGSGSSTGAAGTGSDSGGVTIEGGVHIHAAPGDDGEDLWRKFVRALRDKAQGGDPTARTMLGYT